MAHTIDDSRLPDWFTYPSEFVRVVEQGLVDLTPWHVLERSHAERLLHGLRKGYPDRSLVPFASRQDCDDVACWQKDLDGGVIVIHDFASSGWEAREQFDSFGEWFKTAASETIDWE